MHIDHLRDKIIEQSKKTPGDRVCLVEISGIDASGKGYVPGTLASQIEAAGRQVALINVDGWLDLPRVRFSESNAGEHFYHHALRLDEMFDQLILPLKHNRGLDLTMEFAQETATEFHPHTYSFENIDIILLEGIFTYKRQFVEHFDLKIWIECGFETALKRAIGRGQENLSPDATIAAYENTYFPAQRLHFEIDDPSKSTDLVFRNY